MEWQQLEYEPPRTKHVQNAWKKLQRRLRKDSIAHPALVLHSSGGSEKTTARSGKPQEVVVTRNQRVVVAKDKTIIIVTQTPLHCETKIGIE